MKDHCSLNAGNLLTLDQAFTRIQQAVAPIEGYETVNLHHAMGRVLAFPVIAPIDIPPERVSAMDGFAFSCKDQVKNRPFTLKLVGSSWAGLPFNGLLEPGQCVRIFTGAVVPGNADSVVMQEMVVLNGDTVTLPAHTAAGQNIRQAGSDIEKSSPLLPTAKKINAADCALLASAGIYQIRVKRKIKIGFFSTGDELKPIGHPLQSGQIYDSNRYALSGLLNDACFSVSDQGVIGDNKVQLQKALLTAASNQDAIITTGGASVGEADYIHEILNDCGQVNFWKIAVKPGKPFTFGKIGQCLFFGLPGNPVSVFISYEKLVLPALELLSGTRTKKPLQLKAHCQSDLRKSQGRQEYQRGILSHDGNGEFFVKLAGRQDSHQLSTLSKANCYIVLPAECDGVNAGETVMVEPFSHLI